MNSISNTPGRRQLIAIAAVLLLGGLGAALILRTGDGHGHDEAEHHEEAAAAAPDGEVRLTAAQIQAAGIVIETAAPAELRTTLKLPGEIGLDEDRTAHVVPRVGGVVEAVPVALGQRVARGQLLAVIASPGLSDLRAALQAAQQRLQLARSAHAREQRLFEQRISPQQDVQLAEQALREAEIAAANARQKLLALGAAPESAALGRYELRAPLAGVIVEKHLTLGEQVREDAQVFTVSDLGSVWALIGVPARELARVRVGERVVVASSAFEQRAAGRIADVGALLGEQTRTARARVTLANPDGAWRPGLFVDVELDAGTLKAPVTVAAEALQSVDGRTVVFARTAGGFRPVPVVAGRSDGRRTELVAGLAAGQAYAAAGSFVVKSEAGKATASHAH